MRIGGYQLDMPVLLAPMAGITDLPFRQTVQKFGIGMTVAEMVSAKPGLQGSRKSRQRRISPDEPMPRAIQIVGYDPSEMASAAARNVQLGAGLIDINMGCPAKKVCRKAAGSALLGDEHQVAAILRAVVAAVEVPVTLKIRTGLTPAKNNALKIARIAESEGVQCLTIHGRSRACLFSGEAEYATIRRVKQAVGIPVVANGDISDPAKAQRVLHETGADGVMIGRAAQGQPWLPVMIAAAIRGEAMAMPGLEIQRQTCLDHLERLYAHYGESQGVKIARKHIRSYLAPFPGGPALAQSLSRMERIAGILSQIERFYDRQLEAAGAQHTEALAA